MAQDVFDYIIVGAGSAGCVVANRLSKDNKTSVLLIEAGGPTRSIITDMPAACGLAARDKRFDWGFLTEPEEHCLDRVIIQHRGKGLGGSSAINGMVANRGNPLDYDAWAEESLEEWSFAHCLPYFKRLESFEGGDSEWRGRTGPQSIERCAADHSLYDAFLAAGEQAGHSLTEDQNGAVHEGFHVSQSFTLNGRRHSAATAYLTPAMNRPNLTVITKSTVRRVLFAGRRAVGVEVERSGATVRYEADQEVILCAGAIGSPHLLLLSGIGARDQLDNHDIPLVANVHAVGKNLEDHPIVAIKFATKPGLSLSHNLTGLGKYTVGLRWLLRKTGLGASTMTETGCFFRSRDDVEYADLQHEFYPITAEMGEPVANFDDGFMFSMGLMRPFSRGRVFLKSSDPLQAPGISLNYFSDRRDLQVMVDGLKRTREMAKQRAFDGLREGEIAPGDDVATDSEIEAWLRSAASTEYHPCSTCRMGSDDDSVTDSAGKVHETDALRVIDASIMRHNVTANLNAPVLMIAEKLSDAIIANG